MNVRWLRINYFCLASKKSTFCVCVGFYFRWRRFDFVIYGLYTLSYNFEAPIEKGNSFVYVDWNTTIRFRKVLSVVDLKWVMTLPVAASLPLKRCQSFTKLDSIIVTASWLSFKMKASGYCTLLSCFLKRRKLLKFCLCTVFLDSLTAHQWHFCPRTVV